MTPFLTALESASPVMAKGPADLMSRGDETYADFSRWLSDTLLKCGRDPDRAAAAYVRLCMDYLVLQKELEKTGRYRHSSFDEVNEMVYGNPDIMNEYYLDGLLLSQMWWINHYRITRFYDEEFLGKLPLDGGRALEIGPGHGLFTGLFAERATSWHLTSLDISEHSLDYARRWVTAAAPGALERVTFQHSGSQDPFDAVEGPYRAIVCGEVLEHVEDPCNLLRRLAGCLASDGLAYLTAAIYAASIDHIFLFRSVREVTDLIAEAGLTIESSLALAVNPGDDPLAANVPVNFAFTVRRI